MSGAALPVRRYRRKPHVVEAAVWRGPDDRLPGVHEDPEFGYAVRLAGGAVVGLRHGSMLVYEAGHCVAVADREHFLSEYAPVPRRHTERCVLCGRRRRRLVTVPFALLFPFMGLRRLEAGARVCRWHHVLWFGEIVWPIGEVLDLLEGHWPEADAARVVMADPHLRPDVADAILERVAEAYAAEVRALYVRRCPA